MHSLNLTQPVLTELRHIIRSTLPSTYEVWAYGSRVKQQAHAGSDLDLVIRNPNELDKPSAECFAFKSALQNSNIPILIDVVDWATVSPMFREEILRQYHAI
jgi:uncharacterized protein